MSDDRLRDLERRWRASGDLEDEVALVQERLRVAALEEPRVRLAAGLGRAAAAVVVPAQAPLLDRLVRRYEFTFEGRRGGRWNAVNGADRSWQLGQALLGRLAAAAARCGARTWEAFAATRADLTHERAQSLADLRALVAAVVGLVDAERAVDDVAERLELLAERADIDADDAVHDALDAMLQLSSFVADALVPPTDDGEDDALFVTGLGIGDDDPASWCVALAMNATSRQEVEAAIRHDVGDWALGHGDPLREWAASR